MTGAIVTQSGPMPFPVNAGSVKTELPKGDFKEVFQDVSGKNDDGERIQCEEKTTFTEVKVREEKNHSLQTGETEVRDLNETDIENVETCVDTLKKEIMKTLSVSEEELEEMMSVLGLTNIDLFTKEGISSLVMGFAGVESSIELLTNEGLYNEIIYLNDFAKELDSQFCQEHQMSAEQFEEMLATLEQDVVSVDIQQSANNDTDENQDILAIFSDESEDQIDTQADVAKEFESGENSDTKSEGSNQIAGTIEVGRTQNLNSTGVSFREALAAENTTAQEIYDQITEYMRTNVNADVSEIEMQLNPENLGKLQIHLTSKEGVVSAQFITQNETVKGVLETQLIQLKEQFEQQGVKVDAVEVAVASYSFDQGLNKDAQTHAQEANQARKRITRRINLNEEISEELDNEEKIAVEMMTMNGNTVDFMA